MIAAEKDLRGFSRYSVNLDANFKANNKTFFCKILDIGQGGVKTFIGQNNEKIPEKFDLALDKDEPAIPVELAWQDGPFLGIKYRDIGESCKELLLVDPANGNNISFWRSAVNFFSSEKVKMLEFLIGLLGILFIGYQTLEIKGHNRTQNLLKIEDSERFVNEILIKNKGMRDLLYAPPKIEIITPEQHNLSKLMTFVFLQEWEKQYKMNEVGMIESDAWLRITNMIKNTSQHPLIKYVIEEKVPVLAAKAEESLWERGLNKIKEKFQYYKRAYFIDNGLPKRKPEEFENLHLKGFSPKFISFLQETTDLDISTQ